VVAVLGFVPAAAPSAVALLPRLTTPLDVTLEGVTVVCAKACGTIATQNSVAYETSRIIALTIRDITPPRQQQPVFSVREWLC
jgi:hypothetical protein